VRALSCAREVVKRGEVRPQAAHLLRLCRPPATHFYKTLVTGKTFAFVRAAARRRAARLPPRRPHRPGSRPARPASAPRRRGS
jgi:hypothetical protein